MSAEEKFTPLPNPYIVGNPIKGGEMFYGRQDEFLFAKRKIESGDKSYVIVFCGERRSGKTSILFQILSGKLGDRFLPVLIDMQTMAGLNSDADFFAEIAQEICRTLKDKRLNFREYDFHAPGESPYKCFLALINKITSLYPDKHLVLMIDEYEMIEEKFDAGSMTPDIITFFAGLLEGENRLSFIFTGSKHLEQRKKIEYWRVLFGKSLYRRIGFLSHNDTVRLVTEPVRAFVAFQEGVVEAIYRLTAGQPFYTQVVCQNLIDHLNERQKNQAALSDLETVTEGILQNPLPQMIYIWNSLSDMEKLALTVLAELQQETEAFLPVAKLQRFLRKKDAGFYPARKEFSTALESLYERELVVKRGETYRISIELLGRWVRLEYSFWKTIHEIMASGSVYAQTTSLAGRRKSKFGYVLASLGIVAAAWWLNQQFRSNPADEVKTLTPALPTTSAGMLPNDSLTVSVNETKPAPPVNDNKSGMTKDQLSGPPVPVQMPGVLMVTSQPLGAAIFLNDSLLPNQPTPKSISNLSAGTYRLRLEKLGYQGRDTTIAVAAGAMASIEVALEKLPPGFLQLIVKPYARIFIDEVRDTTTSYYIVQMDAGRRRIRLEHPWGRLDTTLTIVSSETLEFEHTFKKP